MKKYSELNRQYIGGKWIDGSGDEAEIRNPYNEEVIARFKTAGTGDVDKAFAAARDAGKKWERTIPNIRREVLLRAAAILQERNDEITEWLIREIGSTSLKASMEIQMTYDMLLEASSFPTRMKGIITPSSIYGKENFIFRRPIGVVGIISPWNFPLYLSMRSIAPAIAVGNTMVVKPALESPVTGGTFIARLFEEADLPPGVLNVVVGRSGEIGDFFTGHPAPKLISFTGSTPVGKRIGRIGGEGLKRMTLELGGNNAFIILDDADINNAVDAAVYGRFLHQAQICMSTNRILVHEHLYENFRDKLVEKVKSLKYGDPREKDTVIGPLIHNKAVKRVLELIEKTVEAGAKLETGGDAEGNIVKPTILSGVTKDMPIFQEEVFGPAVGLVPFRDDEEATNLANSTMFGLTGALHTRDIQRGLRIARHIETGMVHINDQPVNDEPQTPFGGEKSSGIGRFGDNFILDEMTTVQWISMQMKPRDYPI